MTSKLSSHVIGHALAALPSVLRMLAPWLRPAPPAPGLWLLASAILGGCVGPPGPPAPHAVAAMSDAIRCHARSPHDERRRCDPRPARRPATPFA
jgi:hypothetical protein